MGNHEWIKEFPAAVTVCDAEGFILEMNDRAARMFAEQGGISLLGTNLMDCHPGPARSKLQRIMKVQQSNVYTIEKNGKRKLIYQSPWYIDGTYRGFVEMVMEIPQDMPHFIRTGS